MALRAILVYKGRQIRVGPDIDPRKRLEDMKIRLQICLLGILLLPALGGCVRGCYNSEETVLNQIVVGDPAAPEVSVAKFVSNAKPESLACQIDPANPVRVDLYISASGIVQNVTFLDSWPDACATKYAQNMRGAKLTQTTLLSPIEHFRIDLRTSKVNVQQCMRMQN